MLGHTHLFQATKERGQRKKKRWDFPCIFLALAFSRMCNFGNYIIYLSLLITEFLTFYKTKFPPVFCSKLQDKVRLPLLRNTKCNVCQPRTHSLFSTFWVYFSGPFFGKRMLFQKKRSFLAKLLLFLHCTWMCSRNAALADSPKFHDLWQQNPNNVSKEHIFCSPTELLKTYLI